jgi:hypothetical protein
VNSLIEQVHAFSCYQRSELSYLQLRTLSDACRQLASSANAISTTQLLRIDLIQISHFVYSLTSRGIGKPLHQSYPEWADREDPWQLNDHLRYIRKDLVRMVSCVEEFAGVKDSRIERSVDEFEVDLEVSRVASLTQFRKQSSYPWAMVTSSNG